MVIGTTSSTRPILEVNLQNIVHNYNVARQKVGSTNIAPAVKANAYGVGDIAVSQALYKAGCRDFYVAYLEEAIKIKPYINGANVYILCSQDTEEFKEALHHGFIQVLNTLDSISRYKQLGHNKCVIHFDTGMTRAGLDVKDGASLDLSGLDVRYIMSHLACADDKDNALNAMQLADVKALQKRFVSTPISFANSSGIFLGTDYHLNQVRPGCMIYGINPTPYTNNPIKHVVTLKAKVLQIRTLAQSQTVSYGARHFAEAGAKIATVACGYADGYHRVASFNTHCYFQGIALPIVGTITMDMMMVDVSKLTDDLLAKLDYVELLNDHFTVDDLAKKAKTIGYEVLTSLGNRFNRIYK